MWPLQKVTTTKKRNEKAWVGLFFQPWYQVVCHLWPLLQLPDRKDLFGYQYATGKAKNELFNAWGFASIWISFQLNQPGRHKTAPQPITTMKFEFAKYTEITDLAFEVNPDYKNEGYIRFFICPDVHDFWFVRILEGYNEEYEKEEGCYLLERNNVEKRSKHDTLTVERVKSIIKNDAGDNWDILEGYDLDDLIDALDGGFGILNLKDKEEN